RLIRLRVTALPTFLLTETPIRTGPASLLTLRYMTNCRLATDVPLRKVRRKSPRRLKRCSFCKEDPPFSGTLALYQYVSERTINKPRFDRKKGHLPEWPYADKNFLPLRRRFFNTFRPFLVLIRCRKP